MALITAQVRDTLVGIYISMFRAVPGANELSAMVQDYQNGMTQKQIAAKLAVDNSADFGSVYPGFQLSQDFADSLVESVLGGEVTDAASLTWATNWVLARLNAGVSKTDIIVMAVNALRANTNPAFNGAESALENKVAVANYYAVDQRFNSDDLAARQAALNGVTSDDSTIDAAKAAIDAGNDSQGATYTLTNGADAITGDSGNNLFVATEASLSSADVLNGATGTDTLRYASSGNAAVNESGFQTTNIEIVQVTSDATGGTSFDVTGVTGATNLVNFNSSEDLTLTGMKALTAVTLDNVGSAGAGANDPTPDTTLVFNAAVVAGAADALNVTLKSNLNVDGTGIGDLTAQGVETFNVTTADGASTINTIVSANVGTINISGDQNLTINSNLVSAETINAATFTGNLSVVADSGAIDVVVTGGTGNDRADFSNGWDLNDKFDGGAGTDTLGLTYGVATAIVSTNSGVATNVEILDVTTVANANGTIDMDNFAGVQRVVLNAGIATGVTATIADAVTGLTVETDVDAAATGTLTVNLKTDGTADTVSLVLDNIDAGDTVAAINAVHAETLNISANRSANATGGVTITNLQMDDATVLNLSGAANITISNVVDPTTAILKTVDASTATGNVSITGANFASTGATVKLGAGADTLNMATAGGADTITLGAGADTVVYNAVAQSDADMDTITDFVSGTDKLSFQFANPVLTFLGNKPSFGQAQGSLSAGAAPTSGLDAVFQVDDQILWIDIDDNGTLDNNDFRIKLSGVTSLTAADVGLSASGNTITLSAAAATVNTTTNTNADARTTNFADTINSTIARTVGTTIAGGLGTDTLVLTDAGAVGNIPATITAVEVLQLASVSTTANTGVGFAAGGNFTSVTGSSNADTLTTANMVAGGTINMGAGVDNVTLSADLAGTTINMGADNDTLTINTVATITSTLVGGDGTDTLSLTATDIKGATVSGFETLTTGAGTVTMTATQYAGFTSVTNGGTIALTTAGTVTAVAGILSLGAAVDTTVNSGVAGLTVNGNTGNDTINLTAAGSLAGLTYAETAAGGTDTLSINYDNAAAIAGKALIEKLVIGATQTNGALTLGGNETQLDTTAATNAFTLAATNAAMTSVKLGSGNDTITTVTANTAAQVIELGAGNDTITTLNVGAGNLTVDFGNGNGTIGDIAANGAGVLTLKFAAPATGTTNGYSIGTATANLKVSDILDFASNVTGVVAGKADGTTGVAGANGQVFVDSITNNTNTIITFDADGSRTFTTGDVQIVITGNVINGGINADGNFVISASA